MSKTRKTIMQLPNKDISFQELKEARIQEMEGVLPGYTTEIRMGKYSERIASPKTFERTLFKVEG